MPIIGWYDQGGGGGVGLRDAEPLFSATLTAITIATDFDASSWEALSVRENYEAQVQFKRRSTGFSRH
jgi:hypothetical protein